MGKDGGTNDERPQWLRQAGVKLAEIRTRMDEKDRTEREHDYEMK